MAFKMKGSSYKMGGVKTKDTMAYMNKSPLEAAKPDYIDIDKDGNTTESMKKASMAKMKSPLEQGDKISAMDAYNDGLDKLKDKYSKDGKRPAIMEIPQADKDALLARIRAEDQKKKSPMEMGSAFLTGSKEESELNKGEYKGGSLYNYLENPTEQDAKDALGYASFLENSGNTLYADRAANIRKSIAEDLNVMENDRVSAEETEAENRRFEAEEGGPQG